MDLVLTSPASLPHPLRNDPPGREPLVRARGVTLIPGVGESLRPLLRGIDLDIYPAEVVLLTGHSGSANSALLSLVGGVRTLQGGSLTVLGQDLGNPSASARIQLRRQIGFVFQTHNLVASLTAIQNVQRALSLDHSLTETRRRQRAEELLDRVGLWAHRHRYPDTLSPGECQRVAVARALVGRPRLILADEPTSTLDDTSAQQVAQLLIELARERGCPVLMASHDRRIFHHASRTVHLQDGWIAASLPW